MQVTSYGKPMTATAHHRVFNRLRRLLERELTKGERLAVIVAMDFGYAILIQDGRLKTICRITQAK